MRDPCAFVGCFPARLARRAKKGHGSTGNDGSVAAFSDGRTAAIFLLAKVATEEEHPSLPTQSRAELHMRRRQWDRTSEVPAVHGASHWWALSKAVKPHF
jgi:hypothetical protein